MNESLGDPYVVLGLKHGATENEIRSAYRRLVKLYHPDRDRSLDAQIRYREIRLAYDLLCRTPHPELYGAAQAQSSRVAGRTRSFTEEDVQEIFHDVFGGYGTSGNAGWRVEEREDPFRTFARRWESAAEDELDRPEEVLLTLGTLPGIVVGSVAEVFGAEIVLRACLTSVLLWMTLAPVSKLTAALAVPLTLIGSAVFRRVRPGSIRRNMAHYFLWSLYYGVGMSAVFSFRNPNGFSFFGFLFHILVFYAEVLPLWIHPLAWLGETLAESRKRKRRGY